MNEIILTKESSEEQIKQYFNEILKLSQLNNQFPVNMDEVWMLVYNKKSDAVESLKRDFMEGLDYQVLRQIPQNPNGGRPADCYFITTSCLEFFIARKVRPVFEIYRKVFHSVMDNAPKKAKSSAELFAMQAQINLEYEQRISNVEEKLAEIEADRIIKTEMLLSAPVSAEPTPQISLRDNIRQLVNKYSAATGIKQQDVWHKVYNQLYYLYHINLKAYKKEKKNETYLEVAERNLLLDKIFIIISNLVREL